MRILRALLVLLLLFPGIARADPFSDLTEVLQLSGERDLLVDRLWPVGFSEKGRFAYFVGHADEAVGCFLWELVVVSLVNDKVLRRVSWKDYEGKECLEESTKLDEVIKRHRKTLQQTLAKFGIKRATVALQSFPVTLNDKKIEAVLTEAKQVKEQEKERRVELRQGVLSKSVGSVRIFEMDGIPYVYGHRILGYLKSPFEARVAVVVRQDRRGWEGPPSVATFKLFGASLDRGFLHTGLESILRAASRTQLVPPDLSVGRKWCKKGKPLAKEPIQKSKLCEGWFRAVCKSLGQPITTRHLLLRDSSCDGEDVFRLKIHEWTYKTKGEAKRVGRSMTKRSDTSPDRKRVHLVFYAGRRLYFVNGGAFMWWDRFRKTMKTMEISDNTKP